MIALDTNLLLRYLTQDDSVQSPKATRVIQRLTEEEPGFISLVTVLEIVWVRKSVYKRTPNEIADEIEMILAADALEVQNEQEVYQAVVALRRTGEFEDGLIGALGLWRGCYATLTFDDHAARRLHGFKLVS